MAPPSGRRVHDFSDDDGSVWYKTDDVTRAMRAQSSQRVEILHAAGYDVTDMIWHLQSAGHGDGDVENCEFRNLAEYEKLS